MLDNSSEILNTVRGLISYEADVICLEFESSYDAWQFLPSMLQFGQSCTIMFFLHFNSSRFHVIALSI